MNKVIIYPLAIGISLLCWGMFLYSKQMKQNCPNDINTSKPLKVYNSLQEEREKFQWTGFIHIKTNPEEQWENPTYLARGRYGAHESQKALFKNQLLYFHFQNQEIAKKANISLYLYTGDVKILFENIDQRNLKKEFNLSANPTTQELKINLWEIDIFSKTGDIITFKIRNESNFAVLDYDIQID